MEDVHKLENISNKNYKDSTPKVKQMTQFQKETLNFKKETLKEHTNKRVQDGNLAESHIKLLGDKESNRTTRLDMNIKGNLDVENIKFKRDELKSSTELKKIQEHKNAVNEKILNLSKAELKGLNGKVRLENAKQKTSYANLDAIKAKQISKNEGINNLIEAVAKKAKIVSSEKRKTTNHQTKKYKEKLGALTNSKLQIQDKKDRQTNRNHTQRGLHSIHPALGLLYGAYQDKKHSNPTNPTGDSGGGILSSVLGSMVGGMGGGLLGGIGKKFFGESETGAKKAGGGILKKGMGKYGLGIALASGVATGLETGSVGKGVATGAGGLIGSIVGGSIGGIIGTMILPGVGTVVGETIGQAFGAWFGGAGGDLLYKAASGELDSGNSGGGGGGGIPNKSKSKPIDANPSFPTGYASNPFNNVAKVSKPTDVSTSSNVSKVGGDTTKKEEGFSAKAYADAGKYSIGRGHQITKEEISQGYIQVGDDKIPVSGDGGKSTSLTKEQGDALYNQDMDKKLSNVKKQLGDDIYSKLNDNQKASLGDYAYNVGSINGLVKKGLKDKLASGDTQGASDIIRHGVNTSQGKFNPVLDARRQRNSSLFSQPPPSMVSDVQNASDKVAQASAIKSTQPTNVNVIGGSSSSPQVSNTTIINAPNVDPTIRTLANNMQYPGRILA